MELDLIVKQEALHFKYLPAYAKFLLEHKLDDLARALLQISRDLDIPLLRYFESFTDEQLHELGKTGNRELLEALVANDAASYIDRNLRSWKENQLPLVQSDDIVIEDISKVNFSRRKAFRDLLPAYTSDIEVFSNVMEEIDRFTLAQDEVSYKTLFEMKEGKIRENHHFIDKINNTSPGIIYVFDLLTGKEIYSNHKREEMLGYTDAEMKDMGSDGLYQLLHPHDIPKVQQHAQDFANAADGEILTYEYRVRHKDGTYNWQRGYETIFKRAEDGTPSEIIGIAIDITSEKQATLQLEHREQQLREAQEIAGMGSFDWDLTGNGHSVYSDQLVKIFDLEAGKSLDSFLENVHPSDRPSVKAAVLKAIQDGTMYESEYRYRKSGPEKVIWSRGKVLFEDGRPCRMRGTIMDVTQRHDMLKRLERSEQLHKQAQALTHLGNWSWSVADDHVEWSDEMYRIFGLEPQSEYMTLSRMLSIVHPDDRADRYQAVHTALATGEVEDYVMRLITDDGSLKYIDGKIDVLRDEQGKPYKFVGTCQDITKQVLLNQRLKENEEASTQLINNAPEGIVVIDEASKILLWNPKAEQIFGWTSEEIVGKTLMDTIIPPIHAHLHDAGVKRYQATKVPTVLNKTLEITAIRKNRQEFYISLTVSQSVRAGKDVFIAFIRDISNEKAAELKLEEQRAQLEEKNRELERSNQELTSFNYIASHDLQEPVRKIRIFSNIIAEADGATLSHKAKDAITRISTAAGHMQKLIEGLIAFSRSSSADQSFELTDLFTVLAEAKSMLSEAIRDRGATITASALPIVNGIHFQFQQLFENILGNALKYSRPDVPPVIRIRSTVIPGSEVPDPGATTEINYHHISIEDNGIGFDQQYATRIFELFQRLHNKNEYSGTGIGLSICKKIVQNHDGFIAANSAPGEGTTFHIYLPVSNVYED